MAQLVELENVPTPQAKAEAKAARPAVAFYRALASTHTGSPDQSRSQFNEWMAGLREQASEVKPPKAVVDGRLRDIREQRNDIQKVTVEPADARQIQRRLSLFEGMMLFQAGDHTAGYRHINEWRDAISVALRYGPRRTPEQAGSFKEEFDAIRKQLPPDAKEWEAAVRRYEALAYVRADDPAAAAGVFSVPGKTEADTVHNDAMRLVLRRRDAGTTRPK